MTKRINKAMDTAARQCASCRPIVEYLDRLAEISPQHRDGVDELQSKLEYLERLTTRHAELVAEAQEST